jgi:hypothetical protein
LTNPHTTQLGIYPINKKVMAFELGYSLESVTVLLDRFEQKYDMIRYSASTAEVALKNYLRHSIIKGGKPVEDLLKKEIAKVKDRSLLRYVYTHLANDQNVNQTVKSLFPVLNENDIQNDNENDVSYHDSYHDSSKPKKFTPPTPSEVKAYCQSRNNGINPQRFIDYYEARGWMIGKNKMKDWKAAVRTWEQRNKEEGQTFQTSDLDKFYNMGL